MRKVAAFILRGWLTEISYRTAFVLELGSAVLALTLLALSGIGLASAGIILVTKQGDPVTWFVGITSGFLGGVVFPIEVLPAPIHRVALLLPTTHALAALRQALINGASLS